MNWPTNPPRFEPDLPSSAVFSDEERWLEETAARFEEAWQRPTAPALADYLPADVGRRRVALVELIPIDLECRLKRGEAARVERYLQAYPELAQDSTVVLDLVAAEYALRRRQEPGLGPGEYEARFPLFRDQLAARLAEPGTDPGGARATGGGNAGPPEAARRPTPSTQTPPKPTLSRIEADAVESDGPGIFGDYQLVTEIARGGMGVVYKAWQFSLGRYVALKMIRDNNLGSETAVHRFYQEARSAAALDHPNIVPIHEVGQHNGQHYFTMALVNGPNLADVIADTGPLPPLTAAALALSMAEAVHYAHQRGVIHRDLKPENILMDGPGRPRVTDFGLARSMEDSGRLTSPGELMGTPCYMAPEQARGDQEAIGPTTDIYALGGILYFLLTGQPPFTAKRLREMLNQVVEQPPSPPRALNGQVPEGLEAVCLKCLEKSPKNRFATAADLAEALRPFATVASLPPGTGPVPAPTPGRLRRPGWKWPAGLAVAATVAVLVLSWVLASGGGAKPQDPAGENPGTTLLPVLPVPKHHDFPLRVRLIGGEQDREGVYQLKEGDEVEFQVEPGRAAWVGLWNIYPNGTILEFFPSEEEPEAFCQANVARTLPNSEFAFTARYTGGTERVWVVAATWKWPRQGGQREGPFRIFKTVEERRLWANAMGGARDFEVKRRGGARVAEAMLVYRVSRRK